VIRLKYIEIKVPKAVIYITENEVLSMLYQNADLFAKVLKRGKAFKRSAEQKEREQNKAISEGTL
jgi:hypothetical protein